MDLLTPHADFKGDSDLDLDCIPVPIGCCGDVVL